MNRDFIWKSYVYWLLCEITWKKRNTIKIYSHRNKLNILDWNDFINYIKKYERNK